MKEKNLIRGLFLSLVALGLCSCNSGGSTNTTSSTTPSNSTMSLQTYLSMLDYSSNTANSLKSTNEPQQSFTLNTAVPINYIEIKFYTNAFCNASGLVTTVTLLGNGSTQIPAGTYTSTDQSNNALCALYPSGCSAELANARSVQYSYTYSSSTTVPGACSSVAAGNVPSYLADWNGGSAALCTGSNCGYKVSWTDIVN